MLFWKDFFSSFKCRQPRFCNFFCLEAMGNQSWWWWKIWNIKFYCTLRDHCIAVFQLILTKFMLFWKHFFSSFKCRQPRSPNLFWLEAISNQSCWWWKNLIIKFYCTLRDHCIAVFIPIWTKFMLFWKHFFSSFKCRQPRSSNFIRLEDISNWSWWCQGPIMTTTGRTVIWQFLAQNWLKYHFLG